MNRNIFLTILISFLFLPFIGMASSISISPASGTFIVGSTFNVSLLLDTKGKSINALNVFLSFPVMTGAFSTAVKGDGKFFGEVMALRVVKSQDVMTAAWARLPYDLLQKISSRIVNEVPCISRVVYDITTKPPATMEWE